MNKSALIESLMSTFVEEVAEHVRTFNRDLLALESGQGDPAGLLQSLFRTAHNLKGASRAVDVRVGALRDQAFDNRGMPGASGHHHGRLPGEQRGVGIGAGLE